MDYRGCFTEGSAIALHRAVPWDLHSQLSGAGNVGAYLLTATSSTEVHLPLTKTYQSWEVTSKSQGINESEQCQ